MQERSRILKHLARWGSDFSELQILIILFKGPPMTFSPSRFAVHKQKWPIMQAYNIESARRVTDMQVKPMRQPKQIKSVEQPVVSIDNNVAWVNGSC